MAIGASYKLWLIQYKEGVDFEYEFVWPGGWKLEPPIIENKYQEKVEQQIILPLCWLETI